MVKTLEDLGWVQDKESECLLYELDYIELAFVRNGNEYTFCICSYRIDTEDYNYDTALAIANKLKELNDGVNK